MIGSAAETLYIFQSRHNRRKMFPSCDVMLLNLASPMTKLEQSRDGTAVLFDGVDIYGHDMNIASELVHSSKISLMLRRPMFRCDYFTYVLYIPNYHKSHLVIYFTDFRTCNIIKANVLS